MKALSKLTAFLLVALLASTAFPASGSAAPTTAKFALNLSQTTTIAGTALEPGDYKVYVDRDGSNVKLRVTERGREVINTTGTYKSLTQFSGVTALLVDNSRNVRELQSAKLKGAVVFGPEVEKAAVSEGSSK